MRLGDVRIESARYVAFVAASLSCLFVVLVLGFGYLFVTTDWSGLGCVDGNEPACDARDEGLSAVRASSWVLASVAVAATLGALVMALRLRRVAHVPWVLLLCATSVLIVSALWARL